MLNTYHAFKESLNEPLLYQNEVYVKDCLKNIINIRANLSLLLKYNSRLQGLSDDCHANYKKVERLQY